MCEVRVIYKKKDDVSYQFTSVNNLVLSAKFLQYITEEIQQTKNHLTLFLQWGNDNKYLAYGIPEQKVQIQLY